MSIFQFYNQAEEQIKFSCAHVRTVNPSFWKDSFNNCKYSLIKLYFATFGLANSEFISLHVFLNVYCTNIKIPAMCTCLISAVV